MQVFIVYDIAIVLAYIYVCVIYRNDNVLIREKALYLENKIFWFFSLVFICITAFRHYAFGGPDTINYCYYYAGDKTSYYVVYDEIKDIGYIYINKLFALISKDYNFFIIWSTLFTFFPILYCIYKISGDKLLSLVLLAINMPDVWIQGMCALRQYFATSMLLWAICLYMSNLKRKYPGIIVLLVLACLFHNSFLFIIPIIIIMGMKKIEKRILYICLFVSWLFIFLDDMYSNFMDYFLSLVNINEWNFAKYQDRYNDMNYVVNKTPLNMLPLNLLPACILYFVHENDKNRRLIQIYVLGFCLYNILCKSQIGIRMVTPIIIVGLIALPRLSIMNLKLRDFSRYASLIVVYITWRTIVSLEHLEGMKELYWNYSFFHY